MVITAVKTGRQVNCIHINFMQHVKKKLLLDSKVCIYLVKEIQISNSSTAWISKPSLSPKKYYRFSFFFCSNISVPKISEKT